MKKHLTTIASLSLALSVAACSKSEDKAADKDQAPAAKTAEPEAPAEAAPATGPFAGFDKAAIAAKFEGQWVVGGSSLSTKEAWDVKGDKVTIFNGQEEKTYDFSLESPCSAKVTEKSESGSSSTVTKFAWQDGTLFKGLGNAGAYKDDGSLVACVSGDVYTYSAGSCTKWKQDMFDNTKWKASPAECTVEEGASFTVNGTKLDFVDGALLDQQMQGNKAEKTADFAAAKAALAK